MRTLDDYDQRVKEAEDAAAQARDPDERRAFEQVAELWRELARKRRDRLTENNG